MDDLIAYKIPLGRRWPPVLGVGAYLKNALCLIQGDEAWISRENGSLDGVEAIERFEATARAMLAAAFEKPVAVAHDWHPDFPCTRWAMESGLRPIGVQHHHAHAAAVMAEHHIAGPVLALALDGFGLGENNEAWGGELLRVDAQGFTRLGHLWPLHQAGGDIAARQPWRMGAAALHALGRGEEIAARYQEFDGAKQLETMMRRGLNAPLTTSAGRLFDAACGLLGVMPVAEFEGQAPMALEALVTAPAVMEEGWGIVQCSNIEEDKKESCHSGAILYSSEPRDDETKLNPESHLVGSEKQMGFRIQFSFPSLRSAKRKLLRNDKIFFVDETDNYYPITSSILDLRPLLARLADIGQRQGQEGLGAAQEGANLFHGTLAAALLEWLQKAVQDTGIRQIALGGGCFFNKVLRESLTKGMMERGLEPLLPKQMSVGDPAIALGQAYAVALMIEGGGTE